jgi:YjbE family integral membrane protein
MTMHEMLGHAATLAQVLLIDVTLAGDNAIVVGLAVAGLAGTQKRRAILVGVAAATLIRMGLALVAVRLIAVIGLTLAGGILLLWVCWKMYRELRRSQGAHGEVPAAPSFRAAIVRIIVADLSMSLDNVLAVAGAASKDVVALVAGLAFSVVLMAFAASLVARLLERRRWIAWVGLAIVLFVAVRMVWDGSSEVLHHTGVLARPA